MIPESFSYRRPATLDEALALLADAGDQAKVLAGGHSLLPAMKLRLARPQTLVDVGRVAELRRIEEQADRIFVGAMTTHAQIADSRLLAERCPLLPMTARHIGDLQVRNRGTIGGSLVHADPAADWPAAVLALDAELEIAGRAARRTVAAGDFFVGMLETAVGAGEILCGIRVRRTGVTVAYVKTEQKASGFALCGVAVVIDKPQGDVRIGVTGVAPVPYRARASERALHGHELSPDAIAAAAALASEGVEALSDIHASGEYRLHLAAVNTRRALERAVRAR
jgi:carbon-monoxide dehydrogenase medium subunit